MLTLDYSDVLSLNVTNQLFARALEASTHKRVIIHQLRQVDATIVIRLQPGNSMVAIRCTGKSKWYYDANYATDVIDRGVREALCIYLDAILFPKSAT